MFKWRSSSLTYYVGDIPAGVNPSVVKQIMRDAFDQWSGATNLDFIETSNPTADIEILFGGQYHRKRGSSCKEPFANNKILGHASYPEDGSIHFNTQSFSRPVTEKELLTTAMHEIGHALGLEHSLSMASVMYPSRVALFSELPEVDKQKIQLLYGTRFQTRSNTYPNAPTLCELSKYDAVLREPHKSILIIAGKYCYTPSESGSTPILLSEKWPGAPDTLDAAESFGSNVYIFKNDQVWVFTDTRLQAGYPRNIRDSFPGIPENLDAVAFDHGMYVFAFKNDHYWRYDIHKKAVDLTYELKHLGVPGKIDAAHVQGEDLLLFKDTVVLCV
nr:matrix metalloproteinase-19-like [Aedes albopictus]